jgi:hypothetical protein
MAAARSFHPLSSLAGTIRLLLRGRVHFPRKRLGQPLILDGEKWIIFRQVVIDPGPGQPAQPGAVFRPRFHLRGMSARANMLFSWLPVPFFVGLPGLRSKLWLYDPASGDFSGWYEWDSVEDAERYSRSFAAAFMTRRSLPGSVSFQVLPGGAHPG